MLNIDKALHFLVGLVITATIAMYSPLLGLLVGIVVAVLKEVYDYYTPNHTCDAMDAIATFVGCIVGYILTKEIHAIII